MLHSGLKPNHEKCEIAGTGVLKSVEVAVCGMKCTDLCNETIKKILESTFRTKQKSEMKKNVLESITKTQNVLKVWQMRRLTHEGKIIVFKTLAISRNAFFSFIPKVPTDIISELERIPKTFMLPSKQKTKK